MGIAVVFLFFCLAKVRAAGLSEYEVKAAFLYNFVQFVEWPGRVFTAREAPLVIGIFGTDPFGASLERIIRGESVHGRRLAIKRCRRLDEIKSCQVLFISRSENARVEEILANTTGCGVLTVGDSDNFVRKGGMIGFVLADNNVRFQINASAAKREELIISSRLLKLAASAP